MLPPLALTNRHRNLIENLGYNNERVHTGFLRWTLNERRDPAMARKAFISLWGRAVQVHGARSLETTDISSLETFREKRRRMKIDLEAVAGLNDGTAAYLGVEFKSDSPEGRSEEENPEQRQFAVMRRAYLEEVGAEDACAVLLVVIGDAEFSIETAPTGWGMMGLAASRLFAEEMSQFALLLDKDILNMWIEAFRLEQERREAAYQVVLSRDVNSLSRELGYRSWGAYLAAYQKLKPHLECIAGGSWCIYPVKGNGVLNWDSEQRESRNKNYATYWEFNNRDFALKIDAAKVEDGSLSVEVQDSIRSIRHLAESSNNPELGRWEMEITQKRAGGHPTVLRWPNLLVEPEKTAEAVKAITKPFNGPGGILDQSL